VIVPGGKTVHNVLVIWASPSSANIGVQTLAHGAKQLAQRILGPYGPVNTEFALFNDSEGRALLSNRQLLASLFTKRIKLNEYLKEFDLILDTCGGDSFTDIYGKARFLRIIFLQRAAAQIGIPVIMTHQTFGPFRSKVMQKIATWHLRKNPNILIVCRESKSFEVAEKMLPSNRLVLAADLSFYLRDESEASRSGVALNVSGLLWMANSHVDYLQYRSETLRLLKSLLEAGLAVTVFENVGPYEDSIDDDSIPTEFLKSKFGDSITYQAPKTLLEAKESLKTFDLVVAARMHACLNALAVGTPSIALAYSRKFAPLFDDLGWPTGVDLRTSEYFSTEVLSLIPEFASKRLEARQVADVALHRLKSAEPKILDWYMDVRKNPN